MKHKTGKDKLAKINYAYKPVLKVAKIVES